MVKINWSGNVRRNAQLCWRRTKVQSASYLIMYHPSRSARSGSRFVLFLFPPQTADNRWACKLSGTFQHQQFEPAWEYASSYRNNGRWWLEDSAGHHPVQAQTNGSAYFAGIARYTLQHFRGRSIFVAFCSRFSHCCDCGLLDNGWDLSFAILSDFKLHPSSILHSHSYCFNILLFQILQRVFLYRNFRLN